MADYKIQTNSQKPQELAQALTSFNQEQKEREVSARAKSLTLPYVNLLTTPINSDALFQIPYEEAKEARLICFFQIGKKLRLATDTPDNPVAAEIQSRLTAKGYELHLSLVSKESLDHILGIYSENIVKHESQVVQTFDEAELTSVAAEIDKLKSLEQDFKTMTFSESLSRILVGAVRLDASDIHFQAEEDTVNILFRIDGMLQHILSIDPKTYSQLRGQMKHDAHVKINVDNVPQDGQFSFRINSRRIDVRFSSLPTEFGESIVLRILDSQNGNVDFSSLGFAKDKIALLQKALQVPNGLILVTGPTGSGKTTTLYAMLNRLNVPEKKLVTLEDPVEYHLRGVAQSEIHEDAGFDFAGGLRSVLRQDPDVIMVGEIRDQETAVTAVQAALTGHVVLSTLHTNSAAETITRLKNLNVAPYLFAPAVVVVIAQRLIRKVCPHCAEEVAPSVAELAQIETILNQMPDNLRDKFSAIPEKILHAKGCEKCGQTGYLGRMAIAEILEFTEPVRSSILEDANSTEVLSVARKKNHMLTLSEDGLQKVFIHQTTLTELSRVLGV